MVEFSKMLKHYLKISGTNVYQISQNSDLDRTMMQKMVNGSKLPSQKFFLKFCDYLVLNNKERRDLINMFQIAKYGLDVYTRRKEITLLIRNFQRDRSLYVTGKRILNGEFNPISEQTVILASDEVSTAACYVIDEEMKRDDPYFAFNYFYHIDRCIQYLSNQANSLNKKPVLDQYVHLQRMINDESSSADNIRFLKEALPIAFAFGQRYHVYYHYLNISMDDAIYMIYPYYFMSSDRLLLVTGDYHRGLLITDPIMINSFHHELEILKKNSRLLFEHYYTPEEGAEVFSRLKKRSVTFFFATTFTESLLLKNLDEVIAPFKDLYEKTSFDFDAISKSPNFKMICGIDGLKEFIQSGELPDQYQSYVGSLTLEQRKKALKHYVNCIEKYPCVYFLNNEEVFKHADIDIRLIAPHTVVVFSSRKDLPYGMFVINEGCFYDAFYDYFEGLIEDGSTYDVENSKKYLKNVINHLI